MEFKKIAVSKLTMNTGQIEGVPANPRQWTQADLDRLAASIEETPELLDARGAIVVPHKGKFVVLGGNMRLTAAKKLGLAEMPCAVLPADTPAEKMKEIVVKDNLSAGEWDMDALANEWDDLPLTDWGVPFVPNVEQEVEKAEKDVEVAAKLPFTEVLGEEHNYIVLYFDNEVDWLQAQTIFDIKAVQKLPTANGEQSEAFQKGRVGIGRVMNGAKAIEKILEYKEKQDNED